jgi:hypothetical protein
MAPKPLFSENSAPEFQQGFCMGFRNTVGNAGGSPLGKEAAQEGWIASLAWIGAAIFSRGPDRGCHTEHLEHADSTKRGFSRG